MGHVLRTRVIFICRLQINILQNPVAAVTSCPFSPVPPDLGEAPTQYWLLYLFYFSGSGTFSPIFHIHLPLVPFSVVRASHFTEGSFLVLQRQPCVLFTEVQNCCRDSRCIRPPGHLRPEYFGLGGWFDTWLMWSLQGPLVIWRLYFHLWLRSTLRLILGLCKYTVHYFCLSWF